MTHGILPPDYFPGLEFAALALSCDTLVVDDTIQYVRQSYHNRARLRTKTGTQWITIPVGHGQHGRAIRMIETDLNTDWRPRHLKAFRFNYGASPYYEYYLSRLTAVISDGGPRLAGATVASARFTAEAIGTTTRILVASELPPGQIESLAAGSTPMLTTGQWMRPGISQALRLEVGPFTYRQTFGGFEPGCAAVDLLMTYGPRAADLLRRHILVVPAAGLPSTPTDADRAHSE